MSYEIEAKWEKIFKEKTGCKISVDPDSYIRNRFEELIRLMSPQLDLSEYKFDTEGEKHEFIKTLCRHLDPESEKAKAMGLKDFDPFDFSVTTYDDDEEEDYF